LSTSEGIEFPKIWGFKTLKVSKENPAKDDKTFKLTNPFKCKVSEGM